MKFRFTRKATGVAPRRAAHRGTGRGRVPLTSARRWRAVGWRQGRITKAGNGAARRMLIEAAWSYRLPARIRRELLLRQEGLARSIRDTAWKARSDCVGDIAGSPGRESRRQWSLPQSRVSWRASSGRSPTK